MSYDLFSLLRAYAALHPTRRLQWPSNKSSVQIQDYIINNVLLNDHLAKYPPAPSYQRTFWKWVIEHLESDHAEIDEAIYEKYISVIPEATVNADHNPQILTPPPSYVTHFWTSGEQNGGGHEICSQSVTLLENRTLIEQGTTGMRTWTASIFLANYLISNPHLVRRRVIELGCGTGFLGIITAQLQMLHYSVGLPEDCSSQCSLCLTDGNEYVLDRCRDNLSIDCNTSRNHPQLSFHILDWCSVKDSPDLVSSFFEAQKADVIIGADLVYDTEIIPDLIATLSLALSQASDTNRTKVAYIALTVRNESTVSRFIDAGGESLYLEEICRSSNHNTSNKLDFDTTTDVRIYMLTKSRALFFPA